MTPIADIAPTFAASIGIGLVLGLWIDLTYWMVSWFWSLVRGVV